MRRTTRTLALVLFTASGALGAAPKPQASSDAALLRARIDASYPSLRYVDEYRREFPDEIQGTRPFWSAPADAAGALDESTLTQRLVQLEDQHTAIVGAKAGHTQTLGLLLRSADDGSVVVWRVFDKVPAAQGVREGMPVIAIDGVPTRDWLTRAAQSTMGGNRRGRYAEAALDVGLGTPLVHRLAHLGDKAALTLRDEHDHSETVSLSYRPVTQELAADMAAALDRRDLPETFAAGDIRVGTIRLGAFAPQYDPDFTAASAQAAQQPGADDDAAMLAGYCAVLHKFIADADAVAAQADVLVVDLRGNLGGFDRLARLEADALSAKPSAATFDWFAGAHKGLARLVEEKRDPSCGHIRAAIPMIVYTDAGTRSAGEFMASWLWSAGAAVIGEPTMGAGGGFEFEGMPDLMLPQSGFSVRMSGNFSLFDDSGELEPGERPEKDLVAQVAQDRFAPSRARPFAIQSVGLRPDVAVSTDLDDLRDGGRARLAQAVRALREQGRLPPRAAKASRLSRQG